MSKRTSSLFISLLIIGSGEFFLAGCASHKSEMKARPRDDIAEYRRIVFQSQQATAKAMTALDRVANSGQICPPSVVNAYEREVKDFEVRSFTVRAHAQAIVTRGDAYFENWQEHLSNMKKESARKLAEERRPLMLECFHRIKAASSQTRDAFLSFLSGLRRLRGELEHDPGCVATEPTRALIVTTQAEGRQVQQCLDSVQHELDEFAAIVQPIKAANEH
jgi:hypothetical protein